MEEAVAQAREIGGEACFGAAIEVVALAASFSCDGADADDGAFFEGGVAGSDEVEDADRAYVVDLQDTQAFGPVGFGFRLVAEISKYADGDVGVCGERREEGGVGTGLFCVELVQGAGGAVPDGQV